MKKLLFVIYNLLFVISPSAVAQDHRFYGPEGLNSTLITAIGQSPDGFLWVGSEQGVARFDGYRFAARTSLDDTLRPTVTSSLLCDSDGNVWVGAAHGLYVGGSTPDMEAFRKVLFPDSLLPRVQALLETADGRLLAGTAGYGLFEIDRTALTATHIDGYAPPADNSYFLNLFRADDGTVWKLGTNENIVARRRNGQLQTIRSERGTPVGFFQRGASTYALCHDGVQPLAVGAPALTVPALASNFICCTSDADGNVFAGTYGSGLYWLPRGESAFRRMSVAVSGLDLDRARVETLFTDCQGNLWIGCSGRGLLVVALRRHSPFQTWSFAEQRCATGTYVSAIAEGSGDDVAYWCCVQGDGVYGFDCVGHIVAHPAAPAGVETLMRDSGGRYWLGTSDALWSYNPVTGSAGIVAALPGDRVAGIVELGDSLLAVSTFAAGVALVDKRGRQAVRQLTMHATDTIGRGRLSNNWVYALDVDSRGRLWIGTASGVCCYDPAGDTFASEGWRVLADRETCSALRVLASGDVLMATSAGLLRWSEGKGLQAEAGTEALQGLSIAYIAEDSQGGIWLSTNNGIYTIDNSSRVDAAEYIQGVGLQDADGSLLFATADGLTKLHPNDFRRQGKLDAKVHFTAAAHVDANWHFEFSLMDFIGADATVFEYRFDGDDTWQQLASGENAVTFTHLAPGDYNLLVRANVAGQTTEPSAYAFEVPPPWWRSTWAYIVYALVIAGGIAFVALLYRRHIQHQMDREKLGFLISATNDEATPLTLDELQNAIARYVQSRRQQHGQMVAQAKNVAAMTGDIEQPEVSGNDELLMQRITKSVNRHLGDSEFAVDQMCEEVGISRAHLHRKMKELTGFSVTEFVRNIRLEQAARLLRERKLNITQVAYTVGFSNLGYFSTVFRKHFGVSPRDFVAQVEAAG